MARSAIKQRITVKEPHDEVLGLESIAKPVVAFGKDVASASKSAMSQGQQAVDNVKAGFQKVKRFLTGK